LLAAARTERDAIGDRGGAQLLERGGFDVVVAHGPGVLGVAFDETAALDEALKPFSSALDDQYLGLLDDEVGLSISERRMDSSSVVPGECDHSVMQAWPYLSRSRVRDLIGQAVF